MLQVEGYRADIPLAEKIAAARYLLESVLGRPLIVRGFVLARS